MSGPAKNTSFVLDAALQEFIRDQVDGGGYRSASEVMRDALERFADERRKEEALIAALDHGVSSGRAAPGVFGRVRSAGSGAGRGPGAGQRKKRRGAR